MGTWEKTGTWEGGIQVSGHVCGSVSSRTLNGAHQDKFVALSFDIWCREPAIASQLDQQKTKHTLFLLSVELFYYPC